MHWHGLTPPTNEDGVPFVSAVPLLSNSSAYYNFALQDRGTFWMHSHWAWQNGQGLSAPIVIRDSLSKRKAMTFNGAGYREAMLMLQEVHFRMPCEFDAMIYPEWCPADPDRNDRVATTSQWSVHNYTFLANKREAHDPWVEEVRAGESLRLRVLHAGIKISYVVQLAPELSAPGMAKVVATDGYDTEPADLELDACPGVVSNIITGTATGGADTAFNKAGQSDSSGAAAAAVPKCGSFPIAQAQRTDLLLTIPEDFAGGYYPIVARRKADCTLQQCFGETGGVQVGILLKVLPARTKDNSNAEDNSDDAEADIAKLAKPTISPTLDEAVDLTRSVQFDGFNSRLVAAPQEQLDPAGATPRPIDRHVDMNLTGGYQWFPDYGINGRKWYLLQEHAWVHKVTGRILDIDPEQEFFSGQFKTLQAQAEFLATTQPDALLKNLSSLQSSYDVDHGLVVGTLPADKFNFEAGNWYDGDAASTVPPLGSMTDSLTRLPTIGAYSTRGHHLTVPCDVCMACLGDSDDDSSSDGYAGAAAAATTTTKTASVMPWQKVGAAPSENTKAKYCARKVDQYTFGYGIWGYNTSRQVLGVACSGWADVAEVSDVGQCADWELSAGPVTQANDHPVIMCRGERVSMTIRNNMHGGVYDGHPMHLHGTTAQMVSSKTWDSKTDTFTTAHFPNGPRRDTFWVAPQSEVTVIFDAINPGDWMFHCHIDDHAESGMATSFRYADHQSGVCFPNRKVRKGAAAPEPELWGASAGNQIRKLLRGAK